MDKDRLRECNNLLEDINKVKAHLTKIKELFAEELSGMSVSFNCEGYQRNLSVRTEKELTKLQQEFDDL